MAYVPPSKRPTITIKNSFRTPKTDVQQQVGNFEAKPYTFGPPSVSARSYPPQKHQKISQDDFPALSQNVPTQKTYAPTVWNAFKFDAQSPPIVTECQMLGKRDDDVVEYDDTPAHPIHDVADYYTDSDNEYYDES